MSTEPLPKTETMRKVGIAAVILLAPGGFLFGAALAAKYYRDRAKARAAATADAPPER